jgi:ArsR family transcriptional regulator, arsenate/arsenite/antimonite-responsive transcriptional repressor
MKDAIETFKAVGEPTRFRALRILIDAGMELCACEIIDVLQKPQYTISKSLGGLVAAGLIDERREGRMMMYNLVHGAFNDAIFESVRFAPSGQSPEFSTDTLAQDHQRLLARLSQRSGGECVSGC